MFVEGKVGGRDACRTEREQHYLPFARGVTARFFTAYMARAG
jgi:hypothetical protein